MSKGRDVAKRSAPPGTTTEKFHAHHRKRSCLRKKSMTKVMAEGGNGEPQQEQEEANRMCLTVPSATTPVTPPLTSAGQ